MIKFLSLALVTTLATMSFTLGFADTELPLPGPGAPPTNPPPAAPPPAPAPPHQGAERTYTVGVGQVGRFKSRQFVYSIPPYLNKIWALRVTCTQQKVKIKNVILTYTDGQQSEAFMLSGVLEKPGDSRIHYMYGKNIAKITVVAASSSVFKKNGAFRLDATASVPTSVLDF